MVGSRVLVLLPKSLCAGLLSTPCVGTLCLWPSTDLHLTWSSYVASALQTFTAALQLPLAWLWWGEVVVCSMPQLSVNFLNSSETN